MKRRQRSSLCWVCHSLYLLIICLCFIQVPGADHDVIAAATLVIVMFTIIFFGGGTVPVLRG